MKRLMGIMRFAFVVRPQVHFVLLRYMTAVPRRLEDLRRCVFR